MRRFVKLVPFYFFLPLILDRITKHLVVSGQWSDQVVFPCLNIHSTQNRGIAWGFGSFSESHYFFMISCIVAIVLVYFAWYMYLVARSSGMVASCLLILSGGISNFIDRILYGGVVDFIQFHINQWFFPVFNIADVSITFGAILLMIFFMIDDKQ